MAKAKKPHGAPTKYSEELADVICEWLIGGQSLLALCREDDRIQERTVYNWLHKFPEFKAKYEAAREMAADALFDQTLAIADQTGQYAGLDAADRRLMVDTRKWACGKINKRYCDRSDVNINANVNFTGLDVVVKR